MDTRPRLPLLLPLPTLARRGVVEADIVSPEGLAATVLMPAMLGDTNRRRGALAAATAKPGAATAAAVAPAGAPRAEFGGV